MRDLLSEPNGAAKPLDAAKSDSPAFPSTIYNVSGIPLGGIGTGSIEIRSDGYFHDWLIFNTGAWSPEQPKSEEGAEPSTGPDSLQFFLRAETEGKTPQVRRLGIREDQIDLYSLSFAQPVQGIEFDAKFPFATLRYVDDSLPVEVLGLAFSPVIPHDSRTSGTPGFTMAFKVRNRSKAPVKLSLMGALQNPLAWSSTDRKLANRVEKLPNATMVSMTTDATDGGKSTIGSMAFSVTGDKTSHISGEYRWYLSNGGWGSSHGFGSPYFSYLQAYRRDGRLPSLEAQSSLDGLLKGQTDESIDAMSKADKLEMIERFEKSAFFAEFISRAQAVEPGFLEGDANLGRLLKEFRDRLDGFSGKERNKSTWGSTALESTVDLAPGEEREIRFVLSWFFPNHMSALGPNMGHQYEQWFQNAEDVHRFLIDNQADHRKRVVDFAETMLETSLPDEIAFCWGAQLTTLIKSSWWNKDGRFAIWEGLGCCGLHTTDITYQGSHNLIALFPDLQKRQMTMGAAYQRSDGRIHHFFAPDLLHVDNGFDRVDMNPQFVMMVCRDFLWTNDKEYLRSLWRNVVRAMASTEQLDGSGDGLPDHDTRRNTYDQWDLEGSPAYICSLWLGALGAAIHIANALGETERETHWKEVLAKGEASFVRKLWNGEYFNLWVSDKDRDECCMSDQLSGQWYTNLMGLGHALAPDKVHGALRAVYKHNFDTEQGLVNASYPPGRKKHFTAHQNLQAAANWTGIEYAIASMMIDYGMVDEGLEVIRTVHDRHVRTGHRWEHEECGSHYYRAMSSWATMLALTGFKIDAAARSVSFAPKVRDLIAPWFSTTGYGIVSFAGGAAEIRCKSGHLDCSVLRLPRMGRSLSVSAGAAKVEEDGDVFVVRLGEDYALPAGSSLVCKFE